MEKAIEIKRRAQRCIQNGDLDGALNEYEKLVAAEDSDPYNFVLLADLLFKKGDTSAAGSRYLTAALAYEKAGLYKNGIAVCKKMMRLSLSTSPVLERLAVLHELDGLTTESGLYYVQFAEVMAREDQLERAAAAFRKGFDTCPENVKPLERLSEVLVQSGDRTQAAAVLNEAATHYQRGGQLQDADRVRTRANQLGNGVDVPAAAVAVGASAVLEAPAEAPPSHPEPPDLSGSLGDVLDAALGSPAPPRLDITLAHDEDPADEDLPGPARLSDEVGDAETDPWFETTSQVPSPNGGAAESEADAEAEPADEIAEALQSLPMDDEGAEGDAPGIQFDDPARATPERSAGLGRVEQLLAQAQELFRAGHREAAGLALADAAREYDAIAQHDSAATIYRSLSKGAHAGAEIMMAWLRNCELRGDRVEAAQVACELGDRALNDGDADGAKRWFERAGAFDPANPHAQRRLKRLTPQAPEPAPDPAPAAPDAPSEMGRVEVAVGRGEAVTFDLGSLVSEFQRGVEMQLSGDAQGHYDIGMAYREMGLLEQSVEAFRTASQDPAFAPRCAEMVGRCMLDQGRFDEAAEEFASALELGQAGPELSADLRYQLGLAHEAAGRLEAALGQFEMVYEAQSNYPDVALKIRVLRKTLGNG